MLPQDLGFLATHNNKSYLKKKKKKKKKLVLISETSWIPIWKSSHSLSGKHLYLLSHLTGPFFLVTTVVAFLSGP
jgi:hypothetical protein